VSLALLLHIRHVLGSIPGPQENYYEVPCACVCVCVRARMLQPTEAVSRNILHQTNSQMKNISRM
jgi:hypothetical protein